MTVWRKIAVVWAIAGFTALLGFALFRLGSRTLEGFASPFGWKHWLSLAATVVFMAYSEGYRGFQKKFSPRFAGRITALRDHGSVLECLLAPAYAMGYFAAPRRVMITAWLLSAMVVCFVLVLRLVPQPWRGIADAGVVVGLGWGLLVSLWLALQNLRGAGPKQASADQRA